MKVLFWGTPDFAVPPLRALLGEGFDVVGVVTQPDKPVGRSRSTLEAPPVKRLALEEGIPVFQPEKPRDPAFVARLRELAPDISVVVAYGHILSTELIDLPALGTINIHASLLPKLRGAGPIQAAILEGHTETGVTIMRMVKALDAGASILQVRTLIPDDETYGELQLRLSEVGALAVVEALALLGMGGATETPQDDGQATYAPKITRDMTKVDWSKGARMVSQTIRAFDPKPGAYAVAPSGDVKLYGARIVEWPGDDSKTPGEVLAANQDGLVVACGDGAVQIATVHPAGKKRLSAQDWVRGRGIGLGERLS